MRVPPLLVALALLALAALQGLAAPLLTEGDVIAFVGGEEMVAAAEAGHLQTLLTLSSPGLGLRYRSLAWEGDTVYEQRRDLNYPTLEEQLDRAGATVIFADFGKMESLDGEKRLPGFIAAYERLLDRLAPDGKRRLVLLMPPSFGPIPEADFDSGAANTTLQAYRQAIAGVAARRGAPTAGLAFAAGMGKTQSPLTRDGVHLLPDVHPVYAKSLLAELELAPASAAPNEQLFPLHRRANQLWYHYSRPQNWAFLAGDRTNQPSSRDHVDRTKRWFPEEMEQFLPLLAKVEQEIATLAREVKP